ncbi:MAG: hypothetical protein CM15mP31_1490 [Gammaproteobacteria bacterium]|nr:MAG: hypothetical protein CM15mP31_1490 [Gammaproteobacteria bacterium]
MKIHVMLRVSKVGKDVQIGNNVSIKGDVKLGNNVCIESNVVLSN